MGPVLHSPNLSARDKTGWHELWIQQAPPLDHSLPDEQKSRNESIIRIILYLLFLEKCMMHVSMSVR